MDVKSSVFNGLVELYPRTKEKLMQVARAKREVLIKYLQKHEKLNKFVLAKKTTPEWLLDQEAEELETHKTSPSLVQFQRTQLIGPTQNFQQIELMKKAGTAILNDILDDIIDE